MTGILNILPGFASCIRYLTVGMAFAFSIAATAYAADLLGVRFGPDGEKTRIVIDIDGPVNFAIAGDGGGAGRVFVDFDDLGVGVNVGGYTAGTGHIERYGFAKRPDGGARAVFVFSKTAAIIDAFMIKPADKVAKHRLVVDLVSADMPTFMASLPSAYPDLSAVIEQATADTGDGDQIAAPSSTQKEVKSDPGEKFTIVIDAGHGGGDPGALGQGGTQEKTVTLAAALELQKILKKRKRYNVVLTRASDDSVAVEKREPIARKAGADLFLSLHADALESKAVRGGSVYTLSEIGSARSAKLAKSEGNYRADTLDVSEEVADILFDVTQTSTKNASSRFASKLLKNLTGKTSLLNRSHRQADLRVLLAPDVPAVLFEMGFISNKKDEANLTSAKWRARTMSAVADSIDAFFDEKNALQFAANGAGGAK